MNIVSLSGGIDLLVGALETFTDPRSAYSIMALTAGFLSFSHPVWVWYSLLWSLSAAG